MGKAGDALIGTSGWTYRDWRDRFYPSDLPQRRWLPWYAEQFRTTELNGTFYRTPSVAAVEAWRDQTPAEFVFSWKASRFITHWKRLAPSTASSLALLETRLEILGRKCGPVLFQLPPNFAADTDLLSCFIDMLPKRRRYVFEFRHASWYCDEVYRVLARRRIALCLSDHHDAPAPWIVTAPFVYIRGHGPGGRYRGHYPDRTLAAWADEIESARKDGLHVYAYFDNDQKSAAPRDARRLCELLRSCKRACEPAHDVARTGA